MLYTILLIDFKQHLIRVYIQSRQTYCEVSSFKEDDNEMCVNMFTLLVMVHPLQEMCDEVNIFSKITKSIT